MTIEVVPMLKTGYIEFAWLEYYADGTPAVMLSPVVAVAAEVQSPFAGELSA